MSSRSAPYSSTHRHTVEAAIVKRAAQWMARLWSDDATEDDRAACARWRAEHPDHELAWNRLQGFEDKLYSVPQEAARQALRAPHGKNITRRRTIQLLGLGVVTGGITYFARDTDAWRIAFAEHGTATGDIREIILPDGTQLVLASASAIDVQYSSHERLIVLRAGEIMVTTARDPAPAYRPFRVQGRHGTVQALGTRFTVSQDEGLSHVAVYDGAVEIRPAHAPDDVTRIDAGQATSFSTHHVQTPRPAQESDAAWTRGILVANDLPLSQVIARLGQYRTGLLRCDSAIARLKVTGVFPLHDTDRALHNLTLALPVKTVYRTRYWVTVQPI